ncbi:MULTISPECIES: response regulator [Rathayibacter]|jgi:DNA-binding NarL/FixJ family response regulator|uniref:DNA-binding response regulator n=2 Tax=Rathayibacter festucae TaxID=110937 RepID=A0A3Q9V1R2_9MICO|nr:MULTISPECIES: response regulator transcription factor [Rathayibacter]AZZ54372.1 DNA-binding response regulator [Rathayibacter festucae DSM 15932]MCJ1673492.1 response regulator transcription factor [Rathayibacter sp. VKM Ac-2929]MCJ1681613.1 response regulator transcription factor [Rathayibacter sp. VKM Ac-2928]MCJ1688735.1 response regulator transcription factor [Rathayibacter sp. VKM Ac-2927]MCJ1698182.1 response regulator transcription factor [Rathayibacter festucae]
MTADVRVLLVDDQELVRAGFRTILESEPGIVVVGEARTGIEAIERASDLCPDVICMDVQMPGMDGLAATREIVKDPRLCSSVLILTTFDRDDYLFEALSSGASGFLLKNASPEELVEAVQVVARGDAMLAPDVTRRVLERFATAPARAEVHPGIEELTDREREVLVHLARGSSNAEIAAELYVGEATVKTHVSKILMKLRVRDRIQAVVFAYEHGIAVPGRS